MTLKDYFKLSRTNASSLAKATGVHVSTITRVVNGSIPSPKLMQAIFVETNGAVTPNDFYGVKAA